MKNNISIGKTLANSFQFLIDNFDQKFKEGLPAVLIFTIIFYARSYLISNGIATNFTIIIFFYHHIISCQHNRNLCSRRNIKQKKVLLL